MICTETNTGSQVVIAHDGDRAGGFQAEVRRLDSELRSLRSQLNTDIRHEVRRQILTLVFEAMTAALVVLNAFILVALRH